MFAYVFMVKEPFDCFRIDVSLILHDVHQHILYESSSFYWTEKVQLSDCLNWMSCEMYQITHYINSQVVVHINNKELHCFSNLHLDCQNIDIDNVNFSTSEKP